MTTLAVERRYVLGFVLPCVLPLAVRLYLEPGFYADTMAVMQLILSDVFKDFPNLKIIVSHGGGAIPYQLGRFDAPSLRGGRSGSACRGSGPSPSLPPVRRRRAGAAPERPCPSPATRS